MWKQAGAALFALVIAALWMACSGETSVDAKQLLPCSSSNDCAIECIDGLCRCPDPDEEPCCDPGAGPDDLCQRRCRPIAECDPVRCSTVEDCPGTPDPRCGEASCVEGVCRLARREQLEHQLAGDCQVIQCDQAGRSFIATDDDDVFDDGNECTIDACVNGTNVHPPGAAGRASQSLGYCDGSGALVECSSDEDCGNDPSIRCSARGGCVPQWCTDGDFDAVFGETAADCGGPCEPCYPGQGCSTDDDCLTKICTERGKCALPACDDGTRNGLETDIDCGLSPCHGCGAGKTCSVHDSCESGVCQGGTCRAPRCDDGAMNGSETGVDCGGECMKCPVYLTPPDYR